MNSALARAEKYQESAKIALLHRDSGPRRLQTLQGRPTTLPGASPTPPALETRPLPPPNIPGTPDRAEIGRKMRLPRGKGRFAALPPLRVRPHLLPRAPKLM